MTAHRVRRKLSLPVWEGLIKGWASKFIRTHKWRCDTVHEFDDLLQDAWIIFDKLSRMYPRVVEQARFMALFKASMKNKMNDRASYMQRRRGWIDETIMIDAETGGFSDYNHGYLKIILSEAGDDLTEDELRQLLT